MVLYLLTASLGRVMAQEAHGSISGTVTDPSGAAVPDAHVTAQNVATGVPIRTKTNSTGDYSLLYLIPGQYSLTVEHPSFEKLVRTGIDIRVGDDLKLDLPLSVGNVQQTVVVKETTPMLQAENADLGATMNQAQISQLPLSDGNPFILARLAAGTVFTGSPQFTRRSTTAMCPPSA
ncbi:MAG: carboxypeptidase regulatory-like domain-containing protein [Acidobacteriaceae bacterium]|nr:carboxypeptidase regulatory-like domain-containing protein [Acidobacteriaceae bacterium]